MRLNKLFSVFLVLILVSALPFSSANAARKYANRDIVPDPKKYAAIVVDVDTGKVLHEKNAERKRYPASLVKMMTLYMTFDALQKGKLSMNEYLKVSSHAAAQPSMNINLERGDRIKVRDAIYALIVRSANDASVVLAEAIAGSEKSFAVKMNETAKKLGMKDTHFVNASGLPNDKQVSTAVDMAKMLIALQRDHPKYYRYMTRTNFMRKGRQYTTHNRVLTKYRGATGGKTGYINASGFNLATSAQRRGHNIVAVVLGGKTSSSRDKIMISLLDKGFDMLEGNNVAGSSKKKKGSDIVYPVPAPKPWREQKLISSLGSDKKQTMNIWGIELGGFSHEKEVIAAVSTAMDIVPDQLAYSNVNFVDIEQNGAKSHSARFVSLTEKQAKKACDILSSSGVQNCTVIYQ